MAKSYLSFIFSPPILYKSWSKREENLAKFTIVGQKGTGYLPPTGLGGGFFVTFKI